MLPQDMLFLLLRIYYQVCARIHRNRSLRLLGQLRPGGRFTHRQRNEVSQPKRWHGRIPGRDIAYNSIQCVSIRQDDDDLDFERIYTAGLRPDSHHVLHLRGVLFQYRYAQNIVNVLLYKCPFII